MCKMFKKEKENVFREVMDSAKRTRQVISVYVKNGYRIPGYVIKVDDDTVVIESVNGDIQMVRIDAISTVSGIDRGSVAMAI